MAADTALKRYSAINIACPWRGLNVVPAASITQGERQAVMFLYGGVPAAAAITGGGGGGPLDMGEESPPLKPIITEVEPEDRFRAHRERHARLREHLRVALEGPQAEEVRELVEPVPSDSARPLADRVEYAALSEDQIEAIGRYYRTALEHLAEQQRRRAHEARERALDEDDDDVIMML